VKASSGAGSMRGSEPAGERPSQIRNNGKEKRNKNTKIEYSRGSGIEVFSL